MLRSITVWNISAKKNGAANIWLLWSNRKCLHSNKFRCCVFDNSMRTSFTWSNSITILTKTWTYLSWSSIFSEQLFLFLSFPDAFSPPVSFIFLIFIDNFKTLHTKLSPELWNSWASTEFVRSPCFVRELCRIINRFVLGASIQSGQLLTSLYTIE